LIDEHWGLQCGSFQSEYRLLVDALLSSFTHNRQGMQPVQWSAYPHGLAWLAQVLAAFTYIKRVDGFV